jgi:DNA-binding response OmpR family regulator
MQKILIIEDDKTIVEGLADTLLFHDYEVVTAGSGKEGLALFQKEKPGGFQVNTF